MKTNRNLAKINNITDLVPKHGSIVRELPKGKPTIRNAYSQGPARIITYVFGRAVYRRITFRKIDQIYLLDNSVINDKGDLLKSESK